MKKENNIEPQGPEKKKKNITKVPKPRGYWTKERVLAQAKKYKNVANWKKNCSGSCRIAEKMGWMQEARDKYLTRLTLIITKEDVFKEALKCNRRVDFQKKYPSYYAKALINGWLSECCSHMMTNKDSAQQGRHFRWTEETILKKIKTMKKWSEINKNFPGMYEAIVRLNLKEKIKPLLSFGSQTYWTYERLKKEALKYDTKKKFNKKNAGALRKIYQKGLAKELLAHMKSEEENRTKWTHEKLIKVIKECKTRNNLIIKYPGAYARIKNKKLDYNYLFMDCMLGIERQIIHPKIKKLLEQYKIEFSYEKRFKLSGKNIIPDFICKQDNKIIIIEAKTSGCWASSTFHEIDSQVENQIKVIKMTFPKYRIIHILVSEEGRIKSKNTNFSLSLKELNYYLKYGKHKKIKSKYSDLSLRQLSFKIRNRHIKQFENNPRKMNKGQLT